MTATLQAWGRAGDLVFGLLVILFLAVTLVAAIALRAHATVQRIRQGRARARFTREAIEIAEKRILQGGPDEDLGIFGDWAGGGTERVFGGGRW